MLNNKGQSLVLFVLIIPILLMTMVLVYDIGQAIMLKQELNNISYLTLEYGLSIPLEEDKISKMELMVQDNYKNVKSEIFERDGNLYIDLETNMKGLFSRLVDLDIIKIKSSYVGYIEDGKNVIKKNG